MGARRVFSLCLAFVAVLLLGAGASAAQAGERRAGVAADCLGAPLHSGALEDVTGAGLDQASAQPGGLRTAAVILWDEAGKPRARHAGDASRWTQTARGVRVELSTAQ